MVHQLRQHGNTEPHKRISWLVKNPPDEQLQEWMITPELAQEMLSYNSNNRPVSLRTVKNYGEEMRAGNWRLTYEPIVFSDKGRLIDGQHRLHACLWSGASFPARVAFGDADDNFDHINIGKKRTGQDVFSIRGVPNAALAASTTRILAPYYDRGQIGGDGGAMLPPYELYARYEGFDGLHESIRVGLSVPKARALRGTSPSVIAAAHYICARKHKSGSDTFFQKVITGVGITRQNDPANRLRDRLLDNARAGRGDPKLSTKQILALCLTAWNHMRDGKSPRTLMWDGNDKFPRAR